jgi:hypothetical protein
MSRRRKLAAIDPVVVFALGLIVVSPLTVYRVGVGFNLSLQRILLAVLSATLALQLFRRSRTLRLPTSPTLVALAGISIFLLFECSQLARTEQPEFTRRFLGAFVAGLLVVVALVLAIDTAQALQRALIAFYASALVPVAFGFYQLAGATLGYIPTLPFSGLLSTDVLFLANFQAYINGLAVPRVPSTLAAPAFFGEYLAFVGVGLLAVLLLGNQRRLRQLLPTLALTVLVVTSLVATLARSAWILFAVGALFVGFHGRHQLRSALWGKGRRWLLPATATMCVVIVPVFSFPVGSALSGIVESFSVAREDPGPIVNAEGSGDEILTLNPVRSDVNSEIASTKTHLALRRQAVDLFREHPLDGVGLGNYGVRTGQRAGVSSAQSYGFTVLAEGGMIGVALFAAMLLALVRAARSAYLASPRVGLWGGALLGLYASIVLLVINNLVLYDTLYLDTSWVVIGLALAAANVASRERGIGSSAPSEAA